jgi:peptidoglycan/LPS O-acetylase OafA/YrhL
MQKISNNYLPYLDGLRGYAIILVILSHIGLGHIVPGGLGVTLFFFISGFLITKLLIKEIAETNKIDIKQFYLRRVVRLYPALLFMIFVSVIVMLIVKAPIHFKDILCALFYLTNYYELYFRPVNSKDINIFGILWSLSIEEHFYIFFPVLFYWLYKRNLSLITLLLFISIVVLLIRCYLLYTSTHIDFTINEIYIATHTRIDSIIGGCIAALLIYKYDNKKYLKLLHSYWSIIIGMIIIIFSLFFRNIMFRESIRYSIQSLAFLFIVPAIGVNAESPFLKRIFENKPIILIGRLSYSLYLFHWVAITLAGCYFAEFSVGWFVSTMIVTVILTMFSYYLIERPLVSLRKKLGSNVR